MVRALYSARARPLDSARATGQARAGMVAVARPAAARCRLAPAVPRRAVRPAGAQRRLLLRSVRAQLRTLRLAAGVRSAARLWRVRAGGAARRGAVVQPPAPLP